MTGCSSETPAVARASSVLITVAGTRVPFLRSSLAWWYIRLKTSLPKRAIEHGVVEFFVELQGMIVLRGVTVVMQVFMEEQPRQMEGGVGTLLQGQLE